MEGGRWRDGLEGGRRSSRARADAEEGERSRRGRGGLCPLSSQMFSPYIAKPMTPVVLAAFGGLV